LKDKVEVSGYATLFIGVALLAFTFVSAYLFLKNDSSIAGSPDLIAVFGGALAPLIEACIRIMYLGIMGWIGSVLTIRGVQLVTPLKREAKPEIKSMVVKPKSPKSVTTIQQPKNPEPKKVAKIVKPDKAEKVKHVKPSS
jgi:hypothetical protein